MPSPPLTSLRVLSLIPPMTQLNTPYPSTAYLTGFLRSRGVHAVQHDLALALALALLSVPGLQALRQAIGSRPAAQQTDRTRAFVAQFDRYAATIGPAIHFLQGRDATLAHRIAGRQFLPEGPRFASLDVYEDPDGGDPLAWAFGALGVHDRARHLATLYLNDLADVVREGADARFEFVRYAEALAGSQASYDALAQALAAPPTLVDSLLQRLTRDTLVQHQPSVVLLSVPFPGAVYGALRIAQEVKAWNPATVTVLGGGFVNTELRDLAEPRLFDHIDYVTLDGGERPLLALLEHLQGRRGAQPPGAHLRARARGRPRGPALGALHQPGRARPAAGRGGHAHLGRPAAGPLPVAAGHAQPHAPAVERRALEQADRGPRLLLEEVQLLRRGLDYISRFDAASAETLVDRIQAIVAETGQTGFHFVDEAAPPKSLKALAAELQRRQVAISWWGNIRFEKTFTPELCRQLADSGCIAISGGLEVASDRLLALMNKGVTVTRWRGSPRALPMPACWCMPT